MAKQRLIYKGRVFSLFKQKRRLPNGYIAKLRESRDFVATNRGVFDRAKEAIMAKITENEAAVAALEEAG